MTKMVKCMMREHAYRLYRDKLPDHPLTLKNWVLAEKDLVATMEAEREGFAVLTVGLQTLGRNFFHSQPNGS